LNKESFQEMSLEETMTIGSPSLNATEAGTEVEVSRESTATKAAKASEKTPTEKGLRKLFNNGRQPSFTQEEFERANPNCFGRGSRERLADWCIQLKNCTRLLRCL